MGSYSNPYNSQYVPGAYQPGAFVGSEPSHKRKVDKIGLPENVMVALAVPAIFDRSGGGGSRASICA